MVWPPEGMTPDDRVTAIELLRMMVLGEYPTADRGAR
jgi:hypothetical protein